MDKKLLPEDITLDNIHTLSGDTLQAIDQQKITQAKLIAKQEQDEERIRQEREYRQSQVKAVRTYKVRNILIMLAITVALVGVAITALNFVNKQSQTTPIQPVATQNELLSYDAKKEINFSLAEIRNPGDVQSKLVNEAVASVEGITFFSTDPTLQDLIVTLSPSVPDTFLRTITDMFFGGRTAGNFLVVRVDSYERAYAGLLEWENAMSADITPLFGTIATTTTSFQDKVVENKDTRAIFDAKGQSVLLYGFYNQNTVIFARNEEVFKSVFDSLLRQNL